jgi:hypothetical protein
MSGERITITGLNANGTFGGVTVPADGDYNLNTFASSWGSGTTVTIQKQAPSSSAPVSIVGASYTAPNVSNFLKLAKGEKIYALVSSYATSTGLGVELQKVDS